MNLSIVVPCYNESGNLLKLLDRFREVVAGRPGVEVILVDNGSTDDSPGILARELSRPANRFARSVRVGKNIGYGHGIMTGLRAGAGEYLAWTHADLQTDPYDVILGHDKVLSSPQPGRCFLRGRRVGRGAFDVFFTWGMSVVSSLALGTPLKDINAQPKLFHRNFLDLMTEAPDDFALDLYALYTAKKHGWHVLEQPVHFGERTAGEAKGGGSLKGKYKLSKRAFGYIFGLRKNLRSRIE